MFDANSPLAEESQLQWLRAQMALSDAGPDWMAPCPDHDWQRQVADNVQCTALELIGAMYFIDTHGCGSEIVYRGIRLPVKRITHDLDNFLYYQRLARNCYPHDLRATRNWASLTGYTYASLRVHFEQFCAAQRLFSVASLALEIARDERLRREFSAGYLQWVCNTYCAVPHPRDNLLMRRNRERFTREFRQLFAVYATERPTRRERFRAWLKKWVGIGRELMV